MVLILLIKLVFLIVLLGRRYATGPERPANPDKTP